MRHVPALSKFFERNMFLSKLMNAEKMVRLPKTLTSSGNISYAGVHCIPWSRIYELEVADTGFEFISSRVLGAFSVLELEILAS